MPPRHFAQPRPSSSEEDDNPLSRLSQPPTEFERAKLRQLQQERQREIETNAVLKSFTESLGAVDEDHKDLQLSGGLQDKRRHSEFLDPSILRAKKRQLYHQRLDQSDSDEETQQPKDITSKQASNSVIQVDSKGEIRTLYVKGIPPDLSNIKTMKDVFAPRANVTSFHLLPPHARLRGHAAYITFETAPQALKVKHEFDGTYMGRGYRLGIHLPTRDDDLNFSPDKQHDRFFSSTQQIGCDNPSFPLNAQPVVNDPLLSFTQGSPEYVLRVQYPSSISDLRLAHTMVENVIKHGQEFESIIMQKEKDNPRFDFLFDSSLPLHVYYRWKLYSLSSGQDIDEWPLTDSNGPGKRDMFLSMPETPNIAWIPPPRLPGIEEELAILDQDYAADEDSSDNNNKPSLQLNFLGPLASKHLDLLLEHVTYRRGSIANVMAFAIKNAHAAQEVAERISASVLSTNCPIQTRVIRLWTISDILYNAGQNFTTQQISGLLSLSGASQGIDVASIWRYRSIFESLLKGTVFPGLSRILAGLENRMKSENFKRQILALLQVWESWNVFTPNTVGELEKMLVRIDDEQYKDDEGKSQSTRGKGWKSVASKDLATSTTTSTDIDGTPFGEDDIRYYNELPSPQGGEESPLPKQQSQDKKDQGLKPTLGGKFKISFKKG